MSAQDTELKLLFWRGGSPNAERLAASILRLEGFRNVDPQAPLGGPDGRCDILCNKGGYTYVGAVYFPLIQKDFESVSDKFMHDLEGAISRKRSAFVFLTNQRLTIGNRKELKERAKNKGIECEVYDVEKIAGVLDSPTGYGIRAAFLAIPMSSDEQLAFFAQREGSIALDLSLHLEEIRRVAEMVRRLRTQSQHVAQTMIIALDGKVEGDLDELLRSVDPLSVGELTAEPAAGPISNSISSELILLIHRMVGFELPSRTIGRFRDTTVEIRRLGDDTPYVKPPEHTQVPKLLAELCQSWMEDIASARSDEDKINAIAKFHAGFLRIHPFTDGNGRVARAIMLQQCIDVFQLVDMSKMDRGAEYARALAAADAGNLESLSEIVRKVVAN